MGKKNRLVGILCINAYVQKTEQRMQPSKMQKRVVAALVWSMLISFS